MPAGRFNWQSVWAVFAGLLFVLLITTLTDVAMHASGIFPPWFQPMSSALWVFALSYRIAYGIAGGWVTARLAPSTPVAHAIFLGVIGLVLSLIGAAANRNAGEEYGPQWYAAALVVIALPSAWLGGILHKNETNSTEVT